MTDTENPDPVARSDALDRKLSQVGIPATLDGLRRFVGRQQTIVRVLAISLVVDAFIGVAVLVLAIRANQAAQNANRAENAVYVSCVSGNQARATERTLWDYVLSIPPQQPQTQAQKDQITQFKAFLDTNLAQRDCSALGR